MSPRGAARCARPAACAGALAALLDRPRLRGARRRGRAPTRAGCASASRSVGAAEPGAARRAALAARVPAGAIALLAAPDAARPSPRPRARRRRGDGSTRCATRCAEQAALDLDRDLLGALQGGFAAWVAPGEAAPVIALAARTDDPEGAARGARAPAGPGRPRARPRTPGAPPVFDAREVAGVDAFTLRVSDGFEPTYAVAGDTVVVATEPAGGRARSSPAAARA